MSSVNRVIIIGNLGKDPEGRTAQNGSRIVSFSVATSEHWTDRASGERKEQTEWHRVVIFNEALCKIAEQYLKKGAKVYLEGQLQTRKWTDQAGADKYITEICLAMYRSTLVLLDPRNTDAADDRTPARPAVTPRSSSDLWSAAASPKDDLDDDEIPF